MCMAYICYNHVVFDWTIQQQPSLHFLSASFILWLDKLEHRDQQENSAFNPTAYRTICIFKFPGFLSLQKLQVGNWKNKKKRFINMLHISILVLWHGILRLINQLMINQKSYFINISIRIYALGLGDLVRNSIISTNCQLLHSLPKYSKQSKCNFSQFLHLMNIFSQGEGSGKIRWIIANLLATSQST